MEKTKILLWGIAMTTLFLTGCKDSEEISEEVAGENSPFPSSMPPCEEFSTQMVDGGFETQWFSQKTNADSYLEYRSTVFSTLNSLHTLIDIPSMGVTESPITAYIDSISPRQGKYAIKLVTGKMTDKANGHLLIPGVIAPLDEDYVFQFMSSNGINVKRPYTARPTAFKGYFHYEPVAGDSASVVVRLYNNTTVIGEGIKVVHQSVEEWTPFVIPVVYTSSNDTPTHISIIAASSAGYNFADLTDCRGEAGSTLWLDDLKLEFGN